MAEDTTPPVGGPKSRLHTLDVGDINQNASVSRKTARGDSAGAETDILKEILSAIKNQNTSLNAFIKEDIKVTKGGTKAATGEMARDLRALIRHQVGESTGRGQFADMEAAQAEMDALEGVLKKTTPQFRKWGKLFNQGVLIQFKNNMREMNENVFRTAQNFSNLNSGMREALNKTKDLYELSQTGIIELTAVFSDLGATAIHGRDSLQSAIRSVTELSAANVQTIGVLGNNLEEVAAAFQRNREIAEENLDLDRIPFEQQNVIFTTMLDMQRRAGVQGTNAEILRNKSTTTQISLLQDISFMTGKSVVELIKLQKEDKKSLDQLAAAGAISKEQAVSISKTNLILQQANLGAIGEQIMENIRSGGVESGLIIRMGNDPKLAAMLQQGNNQALLQKITEIASGGGDAAKNAQQIHDLARQMVNLNTNAKFGADVAASQSGLLEAIVENRIPIDIAKSLAEAKAANNTFGAKINATITTIQKGLENTFGTAFSTLGIASAAQVISFIANTVATNKNTAALLTSSLGANVPNGPGGGSKVGKVSKIGKFAKGAGGVAAAGAIGYAIGEYVINPLLNSALEEKTGVKGETLGTYLQTEAYDPAKDPVVFAAAKKAYHERMNKLHTDKMKAISQPNTPVKSSTVDSAAVNAEVQTGQLGKIINLLTIGNTITGKMADTIGTTGPGRGAIISQGVPPGTNNRNTVALEQGVGSN